MPYARNDDLPDKIKSHLPQDAQDIYRKAYNNAHEQYQDPAKRYGGSAESLEVVCAKVAWAAVKKEYEKRGDEWVKKGR